jgi:hypothetical protein
MNTNGAAVPPIPLFSQPRYLRLARRLLFLFGAALCLSSRVILSANLLPHWRCYAVNARVLWTTVIADLFIGLSYVVISELHQRVQAFQKRIQVLFMSGSAEGLPETQLPPGALFLQKPFRFASLLEALRTLQSRN